MNHSDGDFHASGRFMRREDGAIEVKEVVLVAGTAEGSKMTDQHSFTRCSFPQWLDGEAVRVNTVGIDGKLGVVSIGKTRKDARRFYDRTKEVLYKDCGYFT